MSPTNALQTPAAGHDVAIDPKDGEHWRELAKPVRLLTYGGGEPWGSWYVQCLKPWRLSVSPILREALRL